MLRNILLFAVALTVFVAWCGSASTQTDNPCVKDNRVVNDGSCWNVLSETSKASIISGIWVGADSRAIANKLLDEEPFFWVQKDWLAIPESTTIADIEEYFDLLYKTPANRGIQWRWAYVLAALNARDDDSDDRMALLKFLREHESLPTEGEIVGVKRPDVLEIVSDGQRFDIQLSGVSAARLNDLQKQRLYALLRGLSQSVWSSEGCDKARNTYVSIVYDDEIFRQGKILTASVRITTSQVFCLGTRRLSVPELAGDVQVFNLNYFLVAHGLALPDDEIDPKWSKDTQDSRKLEFLVQKAAEAGVYIYGENTLQPVEDVVAYVATLDAPPAKADQATAANSNDTAAAQKSGSGFFVAKGIVATNAHVVAGCTKIVARNADGNSAGGTVRALDTGNDLAILDFGDQLATPGIVDFLPGRPPGVGEPITVAGYPLAGLLGSDVSITTGVVSNNAGPGNDTRFMQISAPVQPGNSGGPVLDHYGRLIGVVVSKLDALAVAQLTGDIPQNVNFAIKESLVRGMLDTYGIEYSTETGAGLDPNEVAKRTTVFIQCN